MRHSDVTSQQQRGRVTTVRSNITDGGLHRRAVFLRSVRAYDFCDLFGALHVINRRGLSRRQTVDIDKPPHSTARDFIDSRASVQFARRPSFVSGKRGVTFFRAMFVDRSGVQIAVRSGPASPNTHWKSKRGAHGGGGIQTLQGSSNRFFTEILFNQKTRLPTGFVAEMKRRDNPRRPPFCCPSTRFISHVAQFQFINLANAILIRTSCPHKPLLRETHIHTQICYKR